MPLEYIILALLIVLLAAVIVLMRRLAAPPSPDPRLDEILANLDRHRQTLERLGELPGGLDDVRTRLAAGGEQQKNLREYLSETRRTIDEVSRRLSLVSQTEDKNAALLERLHRVLLGASSRGQKGENLLREQLAAFPPSVLATNYRLSSGVVEFALRLPDDRVLPIDSKWPEPEMVERLEAAETDEERARYKKQIETKVLKLIGDIKKYIDPEKTTSLAVGALPDSVYTLAGGVHYSAFREGVLLVPYSNAVPILLAIYGLFLKYAQSFDMEQVKGHLGAMDTLLTQLDKIIDNQLARGGTMVANATEECRNVTARIRRSLEAVGGGSDTGAGQQDGSGDMNETEENE